ncbi:hypothetical protein Tco_0693910 [Tanacetum coccineum]
MLWTISNAVSFVFQSVDDYFLSSSNSKSVANAATRVPPSIAHQCVAVALADQAAFTMANLLWILVCYIHTRSKELDALRGRDHSLSGWGDKDGLYHQNGAQEGEIMNASDVDDNFERRVLQEGEIVNAYDADDNLSCRCFKKSG